VASSRHCRPGAPGRRSSGVAQRGIPLVRDGQLGGDSLAGGGHADLVDQVNGAREGLTGATDGMAKTGNQAHHDDFREAPSRSCHAPPGTLRSALPHPVGDDCASRLS
jgi:hypothetical protein